MFSLAGYITTKKSECRPAFYRCSKIAARSGWIMEFKTANHFKWVAFLIIFGR